MKYLSLLVFILFVHAASLSADAPLPSSYKDFVRMTEDWVAPLVPLLEEGKSTIPLEGPASDHGEIADLLESVARPGLLLALWLQSEDLPQGERKHRFSKEEVAVWYRNALVMGTDRKHPEYWGDLLNYYQHGVEMAILTMSLTVAIDDLWTPLSKEEKDQVADWLGQVRGNSRYWNNHLFFAILILEFLGDFGYEEPGDAESINFMFELLEGMHLGNGWFKDGINETYDHYNAYAFHTYGLWWVWQYGQTAPARAAKWKGWAHSFIQDYAHLFAASGEHLPYGRSITYRFNSLGVFGLAPQVGLGALPLGEMRRICRQNLEFFSKQPIGQSQGCLSIGWTDEFHGVAEPYTCPGSPYWAAKGLMMLTLPSDHDFWSSEEQSYGSERGYFERVLPAPRFVLRGLDGDVELLNAGSQVSRGNAKRYGPWKWSKISYRTGHGFLVSDDFYAYPYDAVLTAERQSNGQRFGRHPTLPLIAKRDHLSYTYALGTREDVFNVPVYTDVFWKQGWLLVIHRVNSHEPVRYANGAFALGLEEGQIATQNSADGYAFASNGKLHTAIQNLTGLPQVRFVNRGSGPRQHLTHPDHIVPVIQSDWEIGPKTLALLFWSGREPEEGQPWNIEKSGAGCWEFNHPVLGKWSLRNDRLPEL